jgi:hypothetical protein
MVEDVANKRSQTLLGKYNQELLLVSVLVEFAWI